MSVQQMLTGAVSSVAGAATGIKNTIDKEKEAATKDVELNKRREELAKQNEINNQSRYLTQVGKMKDAQSQIAYYEQRISERQNIIKSINGSSGQRKVLQTKITNEQKGKNRATMLARYDSDLNKLNSKVEKAQDEIKSAMLQRQLWQNELETAQAKSTEFGKIVGGKK